MRDAVGSVQSLLLLGGTSEIGLAIARALVADRTRDVVLAARDPERAQAAAEPLRAAGATVEIVELDAVQLDAHAETLHRVFARPGGVDVAVIAAGALGRGEDQLLDAGRLQLVNGAGASSLMAHAAREMRVQGRGTIVLLSTVAADRPRVSNYAYGASKAAADTFARGLSDALHGSGVDVMIVRPGFVRTRMTEGMDPAPGAVDAPAVAGAVIEGLRARRRVVYVPGFLRWVMLVLRLLPGPVFRRLPL